MAWYALRLSSDRAMPSGHVTQGLRDFEWVIDHGVRSQGLRVSVAVSGDVEKMENLPDCAEAANKEAERLSPGDFDCGRGFEGSVVDFVGI
jgi:hypothetical protein